MNKNYAKLITATLVCLFIFPSLNLEARRHKKRYPEHLVAQQIALSEQTATNEQLGQVSYSQASQDKFVNLLLYRVQNKNDEGYYLEIGAGNPTEGNNTYLFEHYYGWKGTSIDISPASKELWASTRTNPLLIEDATQSNYQAILKDFPAVIDYLSLDIDNNYDTVLARIPFDEHVFKVITIEHDFYRLGNKFRDKERKILTSLGYDLLCPDVMIILNGTVSMFEDWWIYPSAFSSEQLAVLKSLDLSGKTHEELIRTIQNACGLN